MLSEFIVHSDVRIYRNGDSVDKSESAASETFPSKVSIHLSSLASTMQTYCEHTMKAEASNTVVVDWFVTALF